MLELAIQIVILCIAIIALIRAIYTDLKFRYIEDWLTYGLIIVGLIGNGIISLLSWNYNFILYSLIGAGIIFGISAVRYYIGEMGGGDVKLFTGLAAVVSAYPVMLLNYLSPELVSWPFLVTLFINIFLLGIAYQLMYLAYKAISRRKEFSKEFRKKYESYKLLFIIGLGILALPIVILLVSKIIALMFFGAILFYWFALLLFTSILSIDKIMTFEASPSEVEEGDKPLNNIYFNRKLIYKHRRTGLTTADLKILRTLEKQGKIKKLKFKDGIPYAPAFLIGLLFSIILGDLIVIILNLFV